MTRRELARLLAGLPAVWWMSAVAAAQEEPMAATHRQQLVERLNRLGGRGEMRAEVCKVLGLTPGENGLPTLQMRVEAARGERQFGKFERGVEGYFFTAQIGFDAWCVRTDATMRLIGNGAVLLGSGEWKEMDPDKAKTTHSLMLKEWIGVLDRK
jgi:hypothetical protein